MTVHPSIDPAQFFSDHLKRAEPDLLRSMLKTFIEVLMGAEADAICGAPYRARAEERTNSRSGDRMREWDTRSGALLRAAPTLEVVRCAQRDRLASDLDSVVMSLPSPSMALPSALGP